MSRSCTAALVSALIFPTAFAAPHWEYSGESGPETWAQLTPEFASCAGKNQSPINLQGFTKAQLKPIRFDYRKGGQEVIHNGHTIQVNYLLGSSITLDGVSYELKQFHFHAPSENLIEGVSYPLEGHLVHANANGELAVVAIMFKIGSASGASSAPIEAVWKQMPQAENQSAALTPLVNAQALLPKQRDYYRFNGSLTTPPCSEGVRWLVMKHAVSVSQTQVDAFKQVMKHANNRPVQAINAREVLK